MIGGYVLLEKGFNISYTEGAKNRILWFFLAQLGFFLMVGSLFLGIFISRGFK